MFSKKRAVAKGTSTKALPMVVGSAAVFAVGGAMAGFDIVFHDGENAYQVCQVLSITRDATTEGVLEVELDPDTQADEKQCELYLDSSLASGSVDFVLPNGDRVACNLQSFHIAPNGAVVAKLEEGCFGTNTSLRQTAAYNCFYDTEIDRAYVFNVEGLADVDCHPSLPEVVFAGNAFVGTEQAPAEATLQAREAVRILPPFGVSAGSALRAFTSGI